MTGQARSDHAREGHPHALNVRECRRVLDAYGLTNLRGIRPFGRDHVRSPKVVVDADAGRFMLKRRAVGLEDYARIRAEHAAQITLQQAGCPVPAPLATRDGETVAVVDGRFYELYPYIEADGWTPGVASSFAAGSVLARMHGLLGRLEPHGPVEQPCRVADAFVSLREVATLRPALERLEFDWHAAERARAGLDPTPYGLMHGDFHPGNTLWRGAQVAAVVDFEAMRPGPYIRETTLGAVHFALDTTGSDPERWPEAPVAARLEAFWTGYGGTGRFGRAPTEAAAWFMIEGLIAEALPRACRPGGFGRHDAASIIPFIARVTAWLAEHADGLGVVLLQAGH